MVRVQMETPNAAIARARRIRIRRAAIARARRIPMRRVVIAHNRKIPMRRVAIAPARTIPTDRAATMRAHKIPMHRAVLDRDHPNVVAVRQAIPSTKAIQRRAVHISRARRMHAARDRTDHASRIRVDRRAIHCTMAIRPAPAARVATTAAAHADHADVVGRMWGPLALGREQTWHTGHPWA